MIKRFSLFLLLCSGALMLAGSELPLALQSTVTAPRMTITPSHPAGRYLMPVNDGKRKFVRMSIGQNNKVYSYYFYAPGKLLDQMTFPGVMRITVESRASGDIAKPTFSVQYLTKDCKRRIGQQIFTIDTAKDWKKYTLCADVPPETKIIRCLFSFQGKPGATLEVTTIKFEGASDTVKISNVKPDVNLPPSQWKNFPQADVFYSGDCTPAAVQSAVKVAYDENNLYVGVIAEEPEMALLKTAVTKRDGSVWNDDAVSVLVYEANSDLGYQFISNAIGTQFDCQLKQAQAGDPYRSAPWDGDWSVKTFKNKDSWEAAFIIPWKNFGKAGKDGIYSINFARERKAVRADTKWNCYQGRFQEVDKYGKLDLKANTMSRYRKVEKINYDIVRKNPVFKEVLSNKKADRRFWLWGRALHYNYQPASVRKKYTLEQFGDYQHKMVKAFTDAGVAVAGMPWFTMKSRSTITTDYLAEINAKMPWSYSQQMIHSNAIKAGAQPVVRLVKGGSERSFTDLTHDAAIKAFCDYFDTMAATLKKDPKLKNILCYLHGQDEPTNRVKYLYSRSRNPGSAKYLDEVDAMIRKDYGFGKYGLSDTFDAPGENIAFERIAFWRWWTDRMACSLKKIHDYSSKVLPGYDHFVVNRNTCSGLDPLNIAKMPAGTAIGCDPYPTSSRMYFGIGRGIYTTGFNVKLVRDLIPDDCKTVVFLQGFNYCGGVPTPSNASEWTSQALKNGADWPLWYTSNCYRENPALFRATLEISNQLKDLPALKFPESTATAIFYSDYDFWGLNDRCFHSVYALYSILGEKVGSWFKFISKDKLAFAGKKLVYVPRMRFTDPELTGKFMKYMHDGGTLVTFDPKMWTYNIDGSAVAERALFGKLVPRKVASPVLKYGSKRLPLAKILNLPQKENNTIEAYDFEKLPAGARVIATYDDNKPAIVEFAVGKGKWIFSAVQPFGNSDIVLEPGAWQDFMRDQAKVIGEKCDLPIWRFTLPAPAKLNIPKPLK